MKDDYGGTIRCTFIGPIPKMYSIRDRKNCEKSVHKELNSKIGHGEFKDTLINKKAIGHNIKGIKPFNHIIYTYERNLYLNIFICF